MERLFAAQLAIARAWESPHEQFNHVIPVIRSIVQHAAIGAYEQFDRIGQLEDREALTVLNLLRNPNDSSPVDVLNRLIPHLRSAGYTSFCYGWYEINSESKLSDRISLSDRLNKWVAFRNKTHHTIADLHTVTDALPELYACAQHCLNVLQNALPSDTEDGILVHTIGDLTFVSTSLQLYRNQPVVLRRIRSRRGIWFADIRTLNAKHSEDGSYEIKDSPILAPIVPTANAFVTHKIPLDSLGNDLQIWTTDVFVQNRQTFMFKGREPQMEDLSEWYNDTSSSMCLVYGDGGIGKTTLVLEFLHDVLESPKPDIQWFPDIICFYTAKLTQWTADGLKHLAIGGPPILSDALRRLVTIVEENLGREWYGIEDRALVDKVAGVWEAAGISPRNTLLIVDNAETLARKPSDEKMLHDILRMISRKVARVIVTSRRYERIEAWPIEVPQLSPESSLDLLKDLASENGIRPLQQASDATLRNLAQGLDHKPLLLEAVAKYLLYPGVGIHDARSKVQAAVRHDLGEFLYEDAWHRIEENHRRIFMVLSIVDVTITNEIVGWICREINTTHSNWLDAFAETNFGQLTEYGVGYEITLVPEAMEFFKLKMDREDAATAGNLNEIANTVRTRYLQLQEGDSAYISDRVASAFISGAAKAAKFYANRGEYEVAEMWYEEAAVLEPYNSALFDRYAYFLTHYRKNNIKAREIIRNAIRLDGKNEEALFTAGIIEYRMGSLDGGDDYLNRAEKQGKAKHLCMIQRAAGRIKVAEQEGVRMRRNDLLQEAQGIYDKTRRVVPSDRYYRKNIQMCEKGIQYANSMLPTRLRYRM